MVFSEVCHSCGGCQLVCPTGPISEKPKPIGVLETGRSGQVQVISGILNPGEASGVPLIRRALQEATGLSVLDCPPGFHNFQMVHELCTLLKKPCAVVINKQSSPYQPLEDYCQTHGLPILARIPYDRELAERTAQGVIVSAVRQDVWHLFRDVLTKAGGMV